MVPNTAISKNPFYLNYTPYVEFAILDKTNKILSAINSKYKSIPDTIEFGQHGYEDGRRFALTTGFHTCLAYVIDCVWELLHAQQDLVNNKLWIRPVLHTKEGKYKEEWDSIRGKEQINLSGISPISLYTLPWFYTGYKLFPTQEELFILAKVWNAYVGIPWVLLDRDPLAILRANVLQPAGKFKVLTINAGCYMEHSVKSIIFPHISGTALLSPALLWLIYGLSREAMDLATSKGRAKMLVANLPPDDEVSDVINNHSIVGALELWSKGIRDIGINLFNDQYSSVFWPKSLPTFEYLILNGGAFGLGTSPEKNWHLDKPSIYEHCATLLAWERQVLNLIATKKSDQTSPLTKSNRLQIEEASAKALEEMEK